MKKPAPPLALISLAALVGLALFVALYVLPDGEAQVSLARSLPTDEQAAASSVLPLSRSPESSEREGVESPAAAAGIGAEPTPIDDDSLFARLIRVGSIDDPPLLALELEPLLAEPVHMQRVVDLLREGVLEDVGTQVVGGSLAELGASKAIFFAAASYCASPADRPAFVPQGVDGHEFMLRVLNAMAHMRLEVAINLATMLGRITIDGQLLVDSSYLTIVRALRSSYPQRREVFDKLLTYIGEDLGEQERLALYSLFMNELDDPELFKDALAQLLRSESSALVMTYAEDVYGQNPGDQELRRAIRQAIASAAPVDEAARFFARSTDHEELAFVELSTLGMRAGGGEAVAEEYNALVSTNTDPSKRALLVFGMESLGPELLSGIAETDVDANVRGQARVLISVGQDWTPDEHDLEALQLGYEQRDDPLLGLSVSSTVMVARNLAMHAPAGRPELRSGAVELLRELVENEELQSWERESALRALSPYLSELEQALLAEQL